MSWTTTAMKESVPLTEAARRMGRRADEVSARLRYCTQHNLFCPFGYALPPPREDGQWAYIIPRNRFEWFMNGGGPGPAELE